MATIPIFFGYWAVSKDLVVTLASEKYAEAASFSPLILGGTFIYAASCVFNAGLYLQKKSFTMLLIMVCGVAVNISLNYFLLPRYGVFGGAYAAIATSSLVLLLTAKLSSRYLVVRVKKSQIIYCSILSIGMFLAIDFIVFQNVAATLFMKLAVGGIVGGMGILYREKGLVKALKGYFAKKGKEESLGTKNLRLAKDRLRKIIKKLKSCTFYAHSSSRR